MGRLTREETERRRLLKEQGLLPEKEKKPRGRPVGTTKKNIQSSQPSKAGDISIKELEEEIQNDTRSINPVNQDFNPSEDDVVVENFENNDDVNADNEAKTDKTYFETINVPEDDNLEDLNKNEPPLDDVNDDIPDFDANPLEPDVEQRDYTKSGANNVNANSNIPPVEEPIIPEPKINYNSDDDFIKDKKDSVGGNKGTSGGAKDGGGSTINKEPKREPVNPKLDDISPAQKRKAAEKTADAILLTYQQVAPMPFKWASKFNMRKLEKMDMMGELELNGVVAVENDGTETTARDYCEHQNSKVEEIFVITEQMKNDIKEPLVDVLMENNLALTPTQRLVMAVGTQVLQMGIVAGQNFMQNREAIKAFKEFAKDKNILREEILREEEAKRNKETKKQTQTNQQQTAQKKQTKTPPPPPPHKEQEEEEDDDVRFTPPPSDFDNDVDDDGTVNNVSDTPPKKPNTTSGANVMDNIATKQYSNEVKKEDNKLDEYLSVENGGITVEEIPNNEPNDDVQ